MKSLRKDSDIFSGYGNLLKIGKNEQKRRRHEEVKNFEVFQLTFIRFYIGLVLDQEEVKRQCFLYF